MGQGEKHVTRHAPLTERDLDGHADDDDDQAEPEEEGQRSRPRGVPSAAGHDEADHRSDQQQEKRVGVGRLHGADSQAASPPPPRQRVDGTTPADGAVHPSPGSSPGLRLHLSQAAPPSSAIENCRPR